jgi:hypothetical protein
MTNTRNKKQPASYARRQTPDLNKSTSDRKDGEIIDLLNRIIKMLRQIQDTLIAHRSREQFFSMKSGKSAPSDVSDVTTDELIAVYLSRVPWPCQFKNRALGVASRQD